VSLKVGVFGWDEAPRATAAERLGMKCPNAPRGKLFDFGEKQYL